MTSWGSRHEASREGVLDTPSLEASSHLSAGVQGPPVMNSARLRGAAPSFWPTSVSTGCGTGEVTAVQGGEEEIFQ